MLTYAARRLLGAIPTLFLIVTIAFFMIRLAPGGPFDDDRAVPPEVAANLDRAYGLDRPLLVQYGLYLGNVLQGDFGPSFRYKDFTVGQLIRGGLPASLTVGGLAFACAAVIGTALGAFAALRRNTGLDHGAMGIAMIGIAVPNFVVAPLLSLVLGVHLGWLPVAGWDGGSPAHLLLPVTALALPQIAYVARLTRAGMLEVLRADFIRTARAKGLPDRLVVTRHALRTALLPAVSYLGPAAAGILTGSVVIEQIFGIPGIGRHFVQGALNRDYTLVMGVVIFYGALIIAFNLAVDLLYGFLDPRVRYD